MRTVHVVVPGGIDDPARPSGGNVYDRRICDGLAALGWGVHEHAVDGGWPWPDADACRALDHVIAKLPDGAVVLIDGLIASTVPAVLVPHAHRLVLVVVVHLPLGDGPPGHEVANAHSRECAVLAAATSIVTTSEWTRDLLLDRYPLLPNKVVVAEPGTDRAAVAPGTEDGGQLLCVAAVTPHKGHDVLLAALAAVRDLSWHCVLVGTLERVRDFADLLQHRAEEAGIGDRISFAGPRTGAELDRAYAAADLLVVPSLGETYGMVVAEALARGLPVIATAVGGLPHTLGCTTDGRRPGLLVEPGDAPALAAALSGWLRDAELRRSLRLAARMRRETLSDWASTVERIAQILTEAAL
ncbi:MAG TPA: glycosyltransferase family 4 protein [Acidothermaceae bacterium]|jgi:glycosyltransferase involved in cell wall biosynthesis|nr:glycosyltransferase family 4 protein [Acidothermaceae bacterium]